MQVAEALYQACHGTSHHEQIGAMKYLHDIEGREGVVLALLEVLKNSSRSYSDESRLLAIICLKNNVDRCWTSRGENQCVPESERDNLRYEIFELMGEENEKISIQVAVLTARIARHDFPQKWPKLFDSIFEQFDSGDWMRCTHAVSALLQVLLTLHTKRLSRDRNQFREVCISIIEPFHKIWDSIYSQFLSLDWKSTDNNVVSEMGALTNLFCTTNRILQILIMHSFADMHGSVFMQSILVSIAEAIEKTGSIFSQLFQGSTIHFVFSTEDGRGRDIWASVGTWKEDSSVDAGLPMHGATCFGYGLDALDVDATMDASGELVPGGGGRDGVLSALTAGLCLCRVQLSLSVIPLHMQKDCDQDLMTPFVSYYLRVYYCLLLEQTSSVSALHACEPLAVSFVVFLSNVISSCTGLDPSAPLCQFFLENVESNIEAQGKSRLELMLEMVIHKLLRLPQSTLCDWLDDPEELFATLQVASEGDNMRCAAEGLYSSMLYFSPDLICPVVVAIISDYSQQLTLPGGVAQSPLDDTVLLWDNVYTCCGLSPYFISQLCDMSQWARDVLGPILVALLDVKNSPQILPYRLIWMCGCWCHNLDGEVLSELILVCVQYMRKRSDGSHADLLVRLQVISTLEIMLKSENFDSGVLVTVLDDLFHEGCDLISEVTDDNTKVLVLTLFQDILEVIGPACAPSIPALLQNMYWYWEQAGGESAATASPEDSPGEDGDEHDNACLLLSHLLALFTAMARIMGNQEVPFSADNNIWGKFLAIVAFSTSGEGNFEHLCADGIALWRIVLRQAQVMTDDLGLLFIRNVPRLLSTGAIGSSFNDISNFLFLLEGYVTTGGPAFLSNPSAVTVLTQTSLHLLENVKSNVVNHTFRILHFMLVGAEGDLVLNSLMSEGVVLRVVRVCAASLHSVAGANDMCAALAHIAECHKTFFEPDSVVASYLCFFARLMLTSPDIAMGVCHQVAQEASPDLSGAVVTKGMLRMMMDKFDTITGISGGLWQGRACCLCLLSVYPNGEHDLIEWFREVLYLVDGIELGESRAEGDILDHLAANVVGDSVNCLDDDDLIDPDDNDSVEREFIKRALKSVLAGDFTVTTSLQKVSEEKIQRIQEMLGPEQFANLMAEVEKEVLDRIRLNQY